ncbi:hypothetical protein AB0K48_54130 [Nonomuraea sp. NPDC055795]
MEITQMTYALVKEGAEVLAPRVQPVHEVADFLSDHVKKLLEKARATDAPPAGRFYKPEQQGCFRSLHEGTTQEFLDAYHRLATDLVRSMNKATALGLLVALRVNTDTDGVVAGVLKLEILAPNGAALLEGDDGEVTLAAVQDMLDRPGKLQKSALVTSRLPEERVHCGDQLHTQAKYFPDALGIKVHPRPRAAMKAFFDIVWAVEPGLTAPVAEAITACTPGPVAQVLAELGDKVPECTSPVQAEIAERLAEQAMPVAELDPRREVRGTYRIGDITISGPIAEMGQRVQVSAEADGRWRLTIDSDVEPSLERH